MLWPKPRHRDYRNNACIQKLNGVGAVYERREGKTGARGREKQEKRREKVQRKGLKTWNGKGR